MIINNIKAQLINWNTVLSNKNVVNDILVTFKAISIMTTTIRYCNIGIWRYVYSVRNWIDNELKYQQQQ